MPRIAKGTTTMTGILQREISDLCLATLAREPGQLAIDVVNQTCTDHGLDKIATKSVWLMTSRRLGPKGDHHHLLANLAWHSAKARAHTEYGAALKTQTVMAPDRVTVAEPVYKLAEDDERSARERRQLTVLGDKLSDITTVGNEVRVQASVSVVEDIIGEKDARIRELENLVTVYKDELRENRRITLALARASGGAGIAGEDATAGDHAAKARH